MAEVSGVWVWDEIVDFSDWTFGSVRVNFSVQTYPDWHYTEAYSKSRVTLNLVSKEGGDGNYYTSKWNSDTHRIWDFGSTPQTLPQEFLDFLMAHATPQNNVYPPTAELDKASFTQGHIVGRRLARMRLKLLDDNIDTELIDGILYIKNAKAILANGILEVK